MLLVLCLKSEEAEISRVWFVGMVVGAKDKQMAVFKSAVILLVGHPSQARDRHVRQKKDSLRGRVAVSLVGAKAEQLGVFKSTVDLVVFPARGCRLQRRGMSHVSHEARPASFVKSNPLHVLCRWPKSSFRMLQTV